MRDIKNKFPYIKHDENKTTTENLFQKCSAAIKDSVETAIFVLVTVFPLIFHNGYYDILGTKYHCYSICIVILCGVLVLLMLFMMGLDLKGFHGIHTKQILSQLHPHSWKRTFCSVDVMILGFWLTACISTLQSKFPSQAFWGNEGRYCGLFLLTLYMLSYFIISRLWTLNGHLFDLFLASGMIMCIIGITDYFQMDILNFRGDAPTSMVSFTSTIGNINTYTAYVGMIVGFSAAMFAVEKSFRKSLWYYFCLLVSITAIIMGRSDNAYLSLGAVFIFLPFILFKSKKGIQKYLILSASFFSIIQAISMITQRFAERTTGLSRPFYIIAEFKGLPVLIGLLWFFAVMLEIYCRKHKEHDAFLASGKVNLIHIWSGLILIAVLIVCLVLFDANLNGHEERYSSLSSYLIFNNAWGSGRGYIWKKSLWLYNRLSPMNKLFGYGPDTFGCLVNKTIVFQMQNDTGMFFDNAHNSFLQYLLTIGLFGLVFYILFLGTSFYRLFKNKGKSPYILGALLATICYAAQSLVNLDVPIVAPVMWLLISMGMAGCRNTRHPE